MLPKRTREETRNGNEDDEDDSDLEILDATSGNDVSEEEDEEISDDSGSDSGSDNESGASSADEETEAAGVLEAAVTRATNLEEDGRKRKRKNRDNDDLESKYLNRLIDDEERSGKRLKAEDATPVDRKGSGNDDEAGDSEIDETLPTHESLAADSAATEVEKANRTVFLSNVSADAVTSRTAKKTLLKHLASVLDKEASPPHKVESIRFRSTAFSTASMPKRAAYIKKSVMEETTKSTNAYVVYSSPLAARLAISGLNGTIVLDRHLRVDSVAHPAPVDHRRCVFVGNLGFVDDETVLKTKTDEEGNEVTEKKKRTKVPMDVEEGLWRVFGKEAGKVESVRVVRDPVTRIGKGIAYVQFYVSFCPRTASTIALIGIQDANAVESAVLLNGKKFPPMLPRELRVSRCKAPHKTARAMEAKQGRNALPNGKGKGVKKNPNGYVHKATNEDKTLAGRAAKLLGKAAASQLSGTSQKRGHKAINGGGSRRESGGVGTEAAGKMPLKFPEDIVYEGRRASAKDGKPKDLKFKGSGGKSKVARKKGPKTGRAAARAAKWKSNGSKKNN